MEKIVLHVDFDSFFASCEQQFNPKFRNKPIGVTATNGRSCIIASSREAKKLGIKTGSRTFEAFQVCPQLQLAPANFVKYFEISKKFLAICKNYSPFVELFSIDEVFMDVTLTAHLFGGEIELIKKLKKEIREKIGEYITVSVGISHNKLLAKLASGMKKPDGMFKITKENLEAVYSISKLTDICGIGERVKLRLNKIGIYTLLQLKSVPLTDLITEFGKVEGNFLKNIGLGIDPSSLNFFHRSPVVKSVGRNYCLPKNEYNQRVVLQNVYELCEEICIKLRRLCKKARSVGIYLGGDISLHGRKTYNTYFDTGHEMFNLITRLINIDNAQYIRRIGLCAFNLEEKNNTSLSLFDSPKVNSLQKTIDEINERFGDHTIRNGFLLYADRLTTVPNGFMADKYERTKIAQENSW